MSYQRYPSDNMYSQDTLESTLLSDSASSGLGTIDPVEPIQDSYNPRWDDIALNRHLYTPGTGRSGSDHQSQAEAEQNQQSQQDRQQLGDAGSEWDDGDDDDHVLSPTDGYFRASQEQDHTTQYQEQEQEQESITASGSLRSGTITAPPQSSQVPRVPNVWVLDPSLEQGTNAERKAAEAESSRRANSTSDLYAPSTQSGELGAYGTRNSGNISSVSFPATATASGWGCTSPTGRSTAPSTVTTVTTAPSTRSSYYHHPQRYGYRGSLPSLASQQPAPSPSYGRGNIYPGHPPSIGVPFEAPPAYTPSPTSATSTTCSTTSRSPTSPLGSSSAGQRQLYSQNHNYQTFVSPSAASYMGREESQGLLSREPESMGGYPEDDFEDADAGGPIWRQCVRRRLPWLHSRTCRVALLGLVLLAVTLGFLVTAFRAISDKGNGGSSVPKEPVEKPKEPPESYPPYDEDMTFPISSQCADGQFDSTSRFSFAADSERALTITQTVDKQDRSPHGVDIRVYGDVVLRRTDDGPTIKVEIRKNDESIVLDQQWDSRTQNLVLVVPRSIPWDGRQGLPCVCIRATVAVPEGGSLDFLKVDTIHLGVKLLDNLSMNVNRYTQIQTTVGEVVAATNGQDDADQLIRDGAPDSFRFHSRYVSVKTTSAPIRGSWPLYDYLGLESTSGTIKAGVEPKPVSDEDPKPAFLYVKSTSGDVEFWEPVHKAQQTLLKQQQQQGGNELASSTAAKAPEELIPAREYKVNVHTTSGDIKGAVAFTYSARFHSTSGTLAVDLLPVLPSKLADEGESSGIYSELETSSTSGAAAVRVLEPLWANVKGYLTAPAPPLALPPPNANAPPGGDPERGIIVPIGAGDPYSIIRSADPAYLQPGGPLGVPPGLAAGPGQRRQSASSPPPVVVAPGTATTTTTTAAFLRVLRARHSTTSADLGLRLPGSWEGDVDASSMSGKISAGGEGVRIIREGQDWPGVNKRVVARKGDQGSGEASTVKAQTMSGKIDVWVG